MRRERPRCLAPRLGARDANVAQHLIAQLHERVALARPVVPSQQRFDDPHEGVPHRGPEASLRRRDEASREGAPCHAGAGLAGGAYHSANSSRTSRVRAIRVTPVQTSPAGMATHLAALCFAVMSARPFDCFSSFSRPGAVRPRCSGQVASDCAVLDAAAHRFLRELYPCARGAIVPIGCAAMPSAAQRPSAPTPRATAPTSPRKPCSAAGRARALPEVGDTVGCRAARPAGHAATPIGRTPGRSDRP